MTGLSLLPERDMSLDGLVQRAREVPLHAEVFIDRKRYPTLSTEMRDAFPESGWHEIVAVHSGPGNVSYDVKTSTGLIERVCYTWFSKARVPE